MASTALMSHRAIESSSHVLSKTLSFPTANITIPDIVMAKTPGTVIVLSVLIAVERTWLMICGFLLFSEYIFQINVAVMLPKNTATPMMCIVRATLYMSVGRVRFLARNLRGLGGIYRESPITITTAKREGYYPNEFYMNTNKFHNLLNNGAQHSMDSHRSRT